jgi:hypothetical protein
MTTPVARLCLITRNLVPSQSPDHQRFQHRLATVFARSVEVHSAFVQAKGRCRLPFADDRTCNLKQRAAFPSKQLLDRYAVSIVTIHVSLSFSAPCGGRARPLLRHSGRGVPVKAVGLAGAPKGSKSLYGEGRCVTLSDSKS